MIALEKWLTGSTMSWDGLRWAAAGLSLVVHSAAVTLAWVSIEPEPARPIDAFTVELVAVEQMPGARKQQTTVSTTVPVDKTEAIKKTDTALGITSPASKPKPVEPKPVEQKTKTTKPIPQQSPRFEIRVARATPVLDRAFPTDTKPKIAFPPPPVKPPAPRLKKEAVEKPLSEEQSPQETKPTIRESKPAQELAHLSHPSLGGAGKSKAPAKGEAVPLTAASYTIGAKGNQPPEYPERARRNEFEGRVVLRVQVLPNGTSGAVSVQKSSGYDILDQAALAAVKKWRFVPAKRGETAVSASLDVPIIFRLTNN